MQNNQTPYDAKIWVKSYDKHVKPTLDYPKKSLGKLFDEAMTKFPERIGCYFMKREMSFKELRKKVYRFATFIQKNGLRKGDCVAINLPNCPQYLVAHFGTILAGGVASGCSPLMSASEIAYQINDSEAKFFITLDAFYEKVLFQVLDKVPNLNTIITTNISDYMGLSKTIIFLGKLLGKIPKGKVKSFSGKNVLDFLEVMDKEIDLKEVSINVGEDLALLQYTGGTTGLPKGTELTHANLISNITQIIYWLDNREAKEGDVLLSA
ncbi:MAG: AMP-binding protein, partial [Promethearchaeota archaeon]